jgi:hypothetical protein
MRFSVLFAFGCANAFAAGCTDDAKISTTAQPAGSVCEAWEVDSATHTIARDHSLHRFSLDTCVNITDVECPVQPPPDPGPDVTPPPPPPGPIDPPDPGKDKPGHLYLSAPVTEVTLTITEISANETIQVSHAGDGQTHYDARIIDDTHFEVRGDHNQYSSGRTYTVNFVDQDGVTGSCTFAVPRGACGQ